MVDGVLARDASHPLQIHVSKRLRDFELRVAIDSPHERIVLFGPSGSGKTTMLQLVAGTMRPDDGRVEVGGETLFSSELAVNIPARRRGVGYVPQGYALFPHLDVAENVAFGLQKLTRAERATRVAELLRLVNLEDVRSERPARLSGGQQQRTAIARALAPYPRILLLDEPFSSLDGILRSRLRDDIIELQQSLGVPLVTVTHDLTDAFRLAQWFVVLDRGTVLQQGPANDVFFRPATVQVARLVGVRNVLDARVVRSERAEVEVEWNGYLLRSEQGEVASKWTPSVGDRVAICIRPNQLMIRLAQRSYEGRPNVINGSIVDKVLGAENHRLFVRVSGSEAAHDLEVELPGYAYHRLELDGRKDIELSIRPNLLHVIPAD